ncbi:MAG: LysM peptidoglycan-binding domain-containing protein [Aggregatilineales bacterium]
MLRKRMIEILLLVSIFLMGTFASIAQESTAEPEATVSADPIEVTAEPEATEAPESGDNSAVEGTEYIVKAGDTLFRIAINNGVTVTELAAANGITNSRLIFTGQTLIIPTTSETPDEVESTPEPETTSIPEATEAPESEETDNDDGDTPVAGDSYTVVAGDTLFRVAVRFNTTVDTLISLNNLGNRNLIFTGQQLVLPATDDTASDGTVDANTGEDTDSDNTDTDDVDAEDTETTTDETDTVAATDAPADASPDPIDGLAFATGIEVFIDNQDVDALVSQVTQIGVSWVKITVNWADIEAEEGTSDFTTLDTAIDAFNAANVDVLLTLTGTPDWARPSATEFVLALDNEFGPPDDVVDFGTFAGAVAEQYTGKVLAYEIWSEPNLRRSWTAPDAESANTRQLSEIAYIDLLTAAHTAIKDVDDAAIVLTAGLAPTGLNDGLNAIDDRIFLSNLLEQGAIDVSDAIAVQPDGFGNPPEARFPTQSEGVESHFDNRHFFFLDAIADYRATLKNAGFEDVPLWITRVGWGTAEGNNIVAPISPFQDFLTYTSPDEQATYTTDALEIAEGLGYVQAMFIYNLNGCQIQSGEACYYSLLDSDDSARPLFTALQSTGE